MCLNMTPTLERRDGFRFSGTALLPGRPDRPAEHLLDAGGHISAGGTLGRRGPRAVGRGRLADGNAEGAAEGAEAGEADVEADLGHRPVGVAEELHRSLDPAPL